MSPETPITPASPDLAAPTVAPNTPVAAPIDPIPAPIAPSIPSAALNITAPATTGVTEHLPTKKKTNPLVYVAISVVILIICIAGGTYGYFRYQAERPEQVALDVVTDLLSTENLSLSGTITARLKSPHQLHDISALSARIQSHLSFPVTSGSSQISLATGEQTYSFAFGQHIDETTISFQTSGLDEFLTAANFAPTDNSLDSLLLLTLYTGLADQLDDSWWQLDHDALAALITTQYPDIADTSIPDRFAALTCLRQKLTALDRQELLTLYQAHPFIILTPTDSSSLSVTDQEKPYAVTLDSALFTDFANEFLTTNSARPLQTCQNNSFTFPTAIAAAQIESILSHFSTFDIAVTADANQLTAFAFTGHTDFANYTVTFELTYPSSSLVSTPASASPLVTFLTDYYNDLAAAAAAASDEAELVAEVIEEAPPSEYVLSTTPEIRNNDRAYDINIVANALDSCYNYSAGTYTSGNYQGWSDIYDERTLSGPFTRAINPCLPTDIAPSMNNYPYSYDLIAYVRGSQRAGYAVCAQLEPTPGWEYLANSSVIIDTSMYYAGGTWTPATPCTSDSPVCYYCRTSIIR